MNKQNRDLCAEMRGMTSEEACDWLMKRCPPEIGLGEAITLMPHRSWKRREQLRLFHAYFGKCSHYSPRGFEVFSTFMSSRFFLTLLRRLIETEWSMDEKKLHFASYHMHALLKKPEYAAKEDGIRDLQSLMRRRMAELKSSLL